MTDLEKKKMNLELMRVSSARMDLEIKIEEMKNEIERLSIFIKIQETKEIELKLKLEENK
jgi:hypothetical protein